MSLKPCQTNTHKKIPLQPSIFWIFLNLTLQYFQNSELFFFSPQRNHVPWKTPNQNAFLRLINNFHVWLSIIYLSYTAVLLFASSEICSVLKHSEIISAPWSGVALHSTVWRGVWGRGHGSQAAPHQGIELQPSGNSCWFSCLAKPVLPAAIYVQTFILYEWQCVCAFMCVCVSYFGQYNVASRLK